MSWSCHYVMSCHYAIVIMSLCPYVMSCHCVIMSCHYVIMLRLLHCGFYYFWHFIIWILTTLLQIYLDKQPLLYSLSNASLNIAKKGRNMWHAYHMTYIFFVSNYNAAVLMCTVTCDLCVLLFVCYMCLTYFISFSRFVCSQTEIFQLKRRFCKCQAPARKTFCVIALGSCLLENFIFVSIVHSCVPCPKNG
jgi:hypothetical protein